MDRVVQRAGVADAELVQPLPRLLEHVEQLRVRLDVRDLQGAGLVRKVQEEAAGNHSRPKPRSDPVDGTM